MDLGELRREVAGQVIGRADGDYETLRRELVWNRPAPERRPAAIVRAASAADVVAAVVFARRSGLRVSVRGGGHSWVATSQREGALLLDLGGLQGIEVDPRARRATVQPGAIGRELSRRLAAHGLAFPTGHCSTVALGGYLLAGGFGWNAGSWGPACLSVRAIDVVTADGQQLHATESQHPELLWAARGAGPGFFGVVTRFELELQALPGAIARTAHVYPLARLPEVARWLPEVSAAVPRAVEVTLQVGASVPPAVRGDGARVVVSAVAFCDDPGAAARALSALEDSPLRRAAVQVDPPRSSSFEALYDGMDACFPARHRYLADTFWSNDPPERVLGAVAPLLARAPSAKSLLLCVAPPPPPPGAPAPDAAFSMAAGMLAVPYAIWDAPADDAANRAWHRDVVAGLEPSAAGHYLGEADLTAKPSRAARCFGATQWQGLEALRRRYDPDGIFHAYDV